MTGSGQGDTGRRTPEALKSLPPGLLPTGRGSGLEEGATCPGSRSGCSEGSALWWLQTRMNTRAIDEPKPKAERVKPEVLARSYRPPTIGWWPTNPVVRARWSPRPHRVALTRATRLRTFRPMSPLPPGPPGGRLRPPEIRADMPMAALAEASVASRLLDTEKHDGLCCSQ
jgi:hypothetical protein